MASKHRWRDHADLAVEALVVEPVDVSERRPLNGVDALPRPVVIDELSFVEAVEALSEGVVGIALAPHRPFDACSDESLRVANTQKLTRFNRWKQHPEIFQIA